MITIDRTKRTNNAANSVAEVKLDNKLWKKHGKAVKSFTKRVFGIDERVIILGIGYTPRTEGLQAIYYTANDTYAEAINIFSFPITIS